MTGPDMTFNNKRDTATLMRSIYNLAMGVLWTGVGLFFLFHRKWGFDMKMNNDSEIILTNIFGVAAILYGLFRIYRGIKNK
jgi:uncharacterized membrane protein HdeD (DUF308 family)